MVCGNCGESGHNARTCKNSIVKNVPKLSIKAPTPPPTPPPPPVPTHIPPRNQVVLHVNEQTQKVAFTILMNSLKYARAEAQHVDVNTWNLLKSVINTYKVESLGQPHFESGLANPHYSYRVHILPSFWYSVHLYVKPGADGKIAPVRLELLTDRHTPPAVVCRW